MPEMVGVALDVTDVDGDAEVVADVEGVASSDVLADAELLGEGTSTLALLE